MREIFYAFYKDCEYEILVFTSIAEVLIKKWGEFRKQRLKILTRNEIFKFEYQILQKIVLNKYSKFHLSDYHKWMNELSTKCFNEKLIKNGFFKLKMAKKFKIKIENSNFNTNIVDFINTGNKHCLINIFKKIDTIYLPEYREKLSDNKYPFHKDAYDISQDALSNREGLFRNW